MEDPFDIWGAGPADASTSNVTTDGEKGEKSTSGALGLEPGQAVEAEGSDPKQAQKGRSPLPDDPFAPDSAGWGSSTMTNSTIASPAIQPETPSTADVNGHQPFSTITAIADDSPNGSISVDQGEGSSSLAATRPRTSSQGGQYDDLVFSPAPQASLVSAPEVRPVSMGKSDMIFSTETAPTTPDELIDVPNGMKRLSLAAAARTAASQTRDRDYRDHQAGSGSSSPLSRIAGLPLGNSIPSSRSRSGAHSPIDGANGFDDEFHDFDEMNEGEGKSVGDKGAAVDPDDDFGDFDDFEDGMQEVQDSIPAEVLPLAVEPTADLPTSPGAGGPKALDIKPGMSSIDLMPQIRELFAEPFEEGGERYPLFDAAEAQLSKDGIRQVGGMSQVLVTEDL